MNNGLDSNNIRNNLDEGESRLYNDDGTNVVDKNTDFQNNMIKYYENKEKLEQEKEKKKEVQEELNNNIDNLFTMFFNFEKIKDDEDFKKKCKNASTMTIFMLVVCIISFLNFKISTGYQIIVNFISLILFGYSYIALKNNKKVGVYVALISSLFCILSFNIIKIIISVIYIIGFIKFFKK